MALRFFGHTNGKQPALGDEFYNKALPTMFVGMLIWLGTTLYCAGFIGTYSFDITTVSGWNLITFLIAYLIVAVLMFIFAILRVNFLAMIMFFGLTGFTGVMQGVFIGFIGDAIGDPLLAEQIFYVAVVAGVIATAGAVSLGLIYKDKITKHYCIAFLIFGLCIGIMELIVAVIFGGTNQYQLVMDVVGLVYIFGVLVFDAAVLPSQVKRGYWMLAVINIFFDMIAMILRLFFFLLRLKSGDSKGSSSRSSLRRR
jgi:hypothetical protein